MIPHKSKKFMKLLRDHEIQYVKQNPKAGVSSSYKVWMGMDEKIRVAKKFFGSTKSFLVCPTMVNSEIEGSRTLYEWKCEY